LRFYRERVRAGYRAPYLRDLARRVADGKLDLEAWETATSAEIRERVLGLRGMGPYVADQLLRLLGHFEGLGLDSWCRAEYARRYHAGRRVSDRTIARRYARFALSANMDETPDPPEFSVEGV
jgi:N-glycosylase/DNA lyase